MPLIEFVAEPSLVHLCLVKQWHQKAGLFADFCDNIHVLWVAHSYMIFYPNLSGNDSKPSNGCFLGHL
jgi:hypothetical protein